MGLDNGICIKKTVKELAEMGVTFPHFLFPEESFGFYEKLPSVDFEVCYWRKCYGTRNDIFDIICPKEEEFEYALDITDINEISNALLVELYPSYYATYVDNSIWDEEVFFKITISNYMKLHWLMDIKKKYPELEVYFYDNY